MWPIGRIIQSIIAVQARPHHRLAMALDKEMRRERAQLLSSARSTRLPVGGFSALEPTFTVYLVKYYPSSSLPTASTCFNMLKLPEYPTEAILRKNVYTAILYGSAGFSFT